MALGIPNQKRPLARQIGVLFWRGLLDMLRNPLLTAFHALGGLLLGLLVGIIFFSGACSSRAVCGVCRSGVHSLWVL
jgi:hypothetical protein